MSQIQKALTWWDELAPWLGGLIAAFISGGAGAVGGSIGVMTVEPAHFNLAEGLGRLIHVAIASFVASGVAGAAMYLKQKPWPSGWVLVPEQRAVERLTAVPTDKHPAELLNRAGLGDRNGGEP